MNKKAKRTQTTSRINPKTKSYLDLIAAESGISFSALTNSILTEYVNDVRERTQYAFDEEAGLDV